MDTIQIDDINKQILKLGTALPIWGVDASDLVELAENAERAAMSPEARVLQRVRGLLETTTGWHDTLLYWEDQDAAPDLSAEIAYLRLRLRQCELKSTRPFQNSPCDGSALRSFSQSWVQA